MMGAAHGGGLAPPRVFDKCSGHAGDAAGGRVTLPLNGQQTRVNVVNPVKLMVGKIHSVRTWRDMQRHA